MPEPVTIGIGVLTWEYAIKPVVDSIKKEYGEEVKKLLKDNISKAISKLPLEKKEIDVIEAEIIEANTEVLTDENKFNEFIKNNQQINEVLEKLNKREKDININVEKGIGYIETMNGDIKF